jgi:hypothetical protein
MVSNSLKRIVLLEELVGLLLRILADVWVLQGSFMAANDVASVLLARLLGARADVVVVESLTSARLAFFANLGVVQGSLEKQKIRES